MGGAEIIFIVVLGVIILGPEKLPDLARKAGRVVAYLRDIANNARQTLSAELGPEFGDLDLADLNPKTFVRKHILDDGSIVGEVSSVAAEVTGASVVAATSSTPTPLVPAGPPLFDPEAT